MSRNVILKIVLTAVTALALFAVFVYLDDNYLARNRQYSLLDVIAYILLFKVTFFTVPRLEVKIAQLEKRLPETQGTPDTPTSKRD